MIPLQIVIFVQGTSSAIIAVFIKNDCLAEAQSEYRALRAAGQWPDLYALNALLNAYANRFRWAAGLLRGRKASCRRPGAAVHCRCSAAGRSLCETAGSMHCNHLLLASLAV